MSRPMMLTLVTAVLAGPSAAGAQALPSFAQPGISPDGSEIAFVSGGDVWTVPGTGGDARLLIAHSATEGRPLYAPNGRWLAFESDREGTADIWVMELATGALTRLTFTDASEALSGWSSDSEWVYFTTTYTDSEAEMDVARVRPTGGTPMVVLGDRFNAETHAVGGPGNRILLAGRHGVGARQWWRNGHAHIDEAEIWMARISDAPAPVYTRVSVGGKNLWPMWGQDGERAFWMSDRDGTENLWTRALGETGSDRRLTSFSDGRLLWPSISTTGDVIAFERDFGIWTWRDGRASEVPITLRGAVESPRVDFQTQTRFTGLALSPDGQKIAVVARGDIFVAHADSGGPARRVTSTGAPESDVVWDAASRRIAYEGWREDEVHIFTYDLARSVETQVTSGSVGHQAPQFAPEGDRLAYIRDGRALVVKDLAGGEEVVAVSDMRSMMPALVFPDQFAWSPDGAWLAYVSYSGGEYGNVYVVPAGGGEARQVSFVANSDTYDVEWAPDGTYLLFVSAQRTEDARVYRVDLVPQTPVFREDRVARLFDAPVEPRDGEGDAPPAAEEAGEGNDQDASAPVRIELDGIRDRLTTVDTRANVDDIEISPDGKALVYLGTVQGRSNVWTVSLDPLEPSPFPRALTSTGAGKSALQIASNGRFAYFLGQGSVRRVTVPGGDVSTVDLGAELSADFDREKVDVFLEGWRLLRTGFYRADMHGADWDGVRDRLLPRIRGARTVAEMRRIMQLMIGELNASHLGIGGGNGIEPTPVGYLGVSFDRVEYEREGRLRITEVDHLSPAHVADGIDVGGYVRSVDGVTIDATTNLHALLQETVGEQVVLGVSESATGPVREVAVRPIELGQLTDLRYRSWIRGRRDYVDSISGGRLGYVHIPAMTEGTVAQLILDLDEINQRKDGVVIDVRGNNGGFTNAFTLELFTRSNYLTWVPRDGTRIATRVLDGQRALLAPTALVVDFNTLSDGENFTEGYRALNAGPIVGEPTAGWVIATFNTGLLDGTQIRIPHIEVSGVDGRSLELNPRPVDIEVERPLGESYEGRDRQLEATVEALLARIGS